MEAREAGAGDDLAQAPLAGLVADVRHRLDHYRAGRCLPYEDAADLDGLAAAITAEVGRQVDYRPVPGDGAARAARLLAELL